MNETERYVPNGTPVNEYERELLTVLMEECAEVIQAASKILRFGKENRPPRETPEGHEITELTVSNTSILSIEYGHVVCVAAMLIEDRVLDPAWIAEGRRVKKERLAKYMQTQRPGSM